MADSMFEVHCGEDPESRKDRRSQKRGGHTKFAHRNANWKTREYGEHRQLPGRYSDANSTQERPHSFYRGKECRRKNFIRGRTFFNSNLPLSNNSPHSNVRVAQINKIHVSNQKSSKIDSQTTRVDLHINNTEGDKVGPSNRARVMKNRKNKKNKNKLNASNNKEVPDCNIPSFKVNTNVSFENQVSDLISQVERTDKDEILINQVLDDIKYIFGPLLPGVELQVFGSTRSKLAFNTSDIDVFLYCPEGQPEYNFIQEKGFILYKGRKFTNVVRLGRAKVPVIKGLHIATGISVDISITSRVGVCNTLMLKFLITKGDHRIRKLLMLLLLWSKMVNISGVNKLSSYTICLLTIFYLQQQTPPILPPLHLIVKQVDEIPFPTEVFDDPTLIQTTNQAPIAYLFRGFFEFYSNFDFASNVISTFCGEAIPCSYFNDLEKLPDCFSHYKNVIKHCDQQFGITSIMQIQGALDLNSNPAQSVSQQVCEMFSATCSFVVNFLDSFSEEYWLQLLLYEGAKSVCSHHSLTIKFTISDVKHEKFIDAFKVTLKEIFQIKLNEVGSELAKQPKVAGLNPTEILWFSCSASITPCSKKRRKGLIDLLNFNISEYGKEMLISRCIVSEGRHNCNFQAFIVLKCYADGCIEVCVLDTYCNKSNRFNAMAESLRVNLEPYVLLALKEDNLELLVDTTHQLVLPANNLVNLSNLKAQTGLKIEKVTNTDKTNINLKENATGSNKLLESIEKIALGF